MAIVFNNQNNSIGLGSISSSGFTTSISINNSGVGIENSDPSFKLDVSGDTRVRSSGKMRFGGTAGASNFYIQYNSSTNSLDFVAG